MRFGQLALLSFVAASACSTASTAPSAKSESVSQTVDRPAKEGPTGGTCAVETLHATNAGPDGIWRTADDVVAARVITADGFRAEFAPGPDGRLGTDDDLPSGVSIKEGNANLSRGGDSVRVELAALPANHGFYRFDQTRQGPDARWFSADDEFVVTYTKIEGALREGLITKYYDGTRPGPDKTWGTSDDDLGVSLQWRFEQTAGDTQTQMGIWGISDGVLYTYATISKAATTATFIFTSDTLSAPTQEQAQELLRTAPASANTYFISDGEGFLYSKDPGPDASFGTSDDVPTLIRYGGVVYSSEGTDGVWRTADDVASGPKAYREYSVATTYGSRTYRRNVGPDRIFETADDVISIVWDRVDAPQGGIAYYFVSPYWPAGFHLNFDSEYDVGGRPVKYSKSATTPTSSGRIEIAISYPDEPWPASLPYDLGVDSKWWKGSNIWLEQEPQIPHAEWREVTITQTSTGYPTQSEAYTRTRLSTCPRSMPQFARDFDDLEQIQAVQVENIGK